MKHLLLALLVLGCSESRTAKIHLTDHHPGDIGIDPEFAKQREGGLEVQKNSDFEYSLVPYSIAYRPVSVEVDKKNNATIIWSAVESHRMKLPNNPSPKADPFLCLDDQCYRLVKSQKKLPD